MELDGRVIGDAESCFIIAEAGVNHGGSIDCAKKLIDIALWAGADAVKFQIFNAEEIVTVEAEKAEYQKSTTCQEESQFEMIKKLELNKEEFCCLANYAREKGILFLSTPFSANSADVLEEIGVPAYKIASGEITNFPLLEYIARKGKPIILSTGMSNPEEIAEALQIIKNAGEDRVILLHCVTSYPTKIEDINLKAIEALKREFNLPTGLSDHTLGITASIAAAAIGACMIEKHFTLDRNLPGPDHKASLEPNELKEMVEAIHDVQKAMGSGIKKPTAEEEKVKLIARRSIVAGIDIPKGSIITEDMIVIKRPGSGIPPKFIKEISGKMAKSCIPKDTLIRWDMIIN